MRRTNTLFSFLRFFLSLPVFIVFLGCEGPQGPAGKDAEITDLSPPEIYWEHPIGGDTLRIQDTLRVQAFDNVGIDSIVFFVNGVRNFRNVSLSIRNAPYIKPWNTNYLTAGNYSLTAYAYDLSGNIGMSPTILVQSISVLTGIQWLQNYTGTSSGQGYNLPDVDGTTEYAVELIPTRSCTLRTFSFIAALASGQTTFPDLKFYLYNKVSGLPGVKIDSLDVSSSLIQPNLNPTIIPLPHRFWQSGESFYFGLASVSSQRLLLIIDNTPSISRDWYYIASTNNWLRTPQGNLMFRAEVDYGQ